MTDLQKIQFLLDFLKSEKFNKMDLTRAHSLVSSYKWLLDKHQEELKKEKK